MKNKNIIEAIVEQIVMEEQRSTQQLSSIIAANPVVMSFEGNLTTHTARSYESRDGTLVVHNNAIYYAVRDYSNNIHIYHAIDLDQLAETTPNVFQLRHSYSGSITSDEYYDIIFIVIQESARNTGVYLDDEQGDYVQYDAQISQLRLDTPLFKFEPMQTKDMKEVTLAGVSSWEDIENLLWLNRTHDHNKIALAIEDAYEKTYSWEPYDE